MANVDDLDLKILSELSNDASVSIPKLSKKIKILELKLEMLFKSLFKRISKKGINKPIPIASEKVANNIKLTLKIVFKGNSLVTSDKRENISLFIIIFSFKIFLKFIKSIDII